MALRRNCGLHPGAPRSRRADAAAAARCRWGDPGAAPGGRSRIRLNVLDVGLETRVAAELWSVATGGYQHRRLLVSSADVQTLRDAYAAFARQDIPGVMAAFHEDIEWESPDSIPFGGVYHGHAGVGDFFSQLPEHWEELRVEPEEFVDGGDTVVVVVGLRGKGAGGSLDSKSLHLWRMRGGKAVAFREYPDTARVLQALGQQTPATA